MADYRIAVLDIGKTNKKLFVYDSDLKCLNPDEAGASFPQVKIDGVVCDDAAAIYRWMMEGLAEAGRRWGDIRCISVTTHGATIALLGDGRDEIFEGDGGLVFPVVSYEQAISAEDDEAFYAAVGEAPERLQETTGTARFGLLLNAAKQVFWLSRRFPERFARVRDILMWPQYFAYLLTGRKAAEPTYLGCHGYFLDINGREYSIVADALGITGKLPPLPLRNSWEVLGALDGGIARKTGLDPTTLVTMGVHDSNAALVPYFVEGFENFVVQDSGTWVVSMSPRDEANFEEGEIGREVFFNRSVYGGPVKTTIFRGGAEFDFYREKILAGAPHPEEIDRRVLSQIIRAREAFALPTVERGSGLFPESVARLEGLDTVFRDGAHAWCTVDLGLAIQGYCGARMAGGDRMEKIFIEGNIGRRNPIYRSVIATLSAGADTFIGGAGGAAFGAALLGAAAVEGRRPEELRDRLDFTPTRVEPLGEVAGDIRSYAEDFLARLGARLP